MDIFRVGRHKKASLQLSINAIVVLILAITLLGLGLGFIKKQFGAVEAQFTAVGEEIKSGIIEKIQASGELLVFNRIDVTVGKGKPEDFYMGIKNTQTAEDQFTVTFECISAIGGSCPTDASDWFQTFELYEIQSGQVGVLPVTLLADETGKFLMTVKVDGVNIQDYADKEFFLTVR